MNLDATDEVRGSFDQRKAGPIAQTFKVAASSREEIDRDGGTIIEPTGALNRKEAGSNRISVETVIIQVTLRHQSLVEIRKIKTIQKNQIR